MVSIGVTDFVGVGTFDEYDDEEDLVVIISLVDPSDILDVMTSLVDPSEDVDVMTSLVDPSEDIDVITCFVDTSEDVDVMTPLVDSFEKNGSCVVDGLSDIKYVIIVVGVVTSLENFDSMSTVVRSEFVVCTKGMLVLVDIGRNGDLGFSDVLSGNLVDCESVFISTVLLWSVSMSTAFVSIVDDGSEVVFRWITGTGSIVEGVDVGAK